MANISKLSVSTLNFRYFRQMAIYTHIRLYLMLPWVWFKSCSNQCLYNIRCLKFEELKSYYNMHDSSVDLSWHNKDPAGSRQVKILHPLQPEPLVWALIPFLVLTSGTLALQINSFKPWWISYITNLASSTLSDLL